MDLAVAALGHVMVALHTYGTCKSFHKLLTYTQQTVSISTIEHVKKVPTRTGPCCAPSACNPC